MTEHTASSHPDLLVGIGTADDAGVYALGDGRALVQTVDIFTPVVDSPYDWGRVAAANALSDVYAMGGIPLTALQYMAWPRDDIPFDIAGEVSTGGLDVMASAGCTVVGGHSIDGREPTYGFAVTGLVDSDSVLTNAGARPGDVLVITKPLGTGIITTAIKRGTCPEELAAEVVEVMTTLNDVAAQATREHDVSAATDVTGFGLLGHLGELCLASGVGAEIRSADVPVIDGVIGLLRQGMWAGGSQRNLESMREAIVSHVDEETVKVLVDAQTSGGLLLAMAPDSVDSYLGKVRGAVAIGSLTASPSMTVR